MKTTRMLLIVFLALGLASVSLAAEDTWTTNSPMPTARYVLSSSVVDGKVYAIGGEPGTSVALSTVEAYDPATDNWTGKANMPMARAAGASSAVNGRIYVIGGNATPYGAPYSSVIEYDATMDTWTRKADIPTPRICLSSSVVNGKIYAIGGKLSFQGTVLSTVEEYDPATDTWTRKANMPTARAYVSTSAVNGKIYAIGGTLVNPEWYRGLTTVEEYDPATDTWTTKSPMPTGRTYFSTSVVNGKIYAIGGVSAGNTDHVSSVEEYDPATDTWTRKADIPTARSGLTTSAVNGKIYAIGGWVGSYIAISTVEEYDTGFILVDFNGDGRVDFKDYAIFAQSAYDDGKLDAKTLAVLVADWLTAWTIPPLPGPASNPEPANDATDVDLNAELSWTAGVYATSYDVSFGTSNPPPFIGNQTAATFDPGIMVYSSTYYWRIDSVNIWGTATGTVWSFTTIYSDLQASNPNPTDDALGVDIDADLSWTAGVGATSHDVYFGTSNPPPFQLNQTTATFNPGTMAYSTTYYWRIDETGAYGTTTGMVWSFTNMMSPPPF